MTWAIVFVFVSCPTGGSSCPLICPPYCPRPWGLLGWGVDAEKENRDGVRRVGGAEGRGGGGGIKER